MLGTMARDSATTAAMKGDPGQGDGGGGGQDAPKASSKRRCVQSACVPCRKRKSKCDGGTPVCATCTAVYKTPCFYDQESETRRSKTTTAQKQRTSSIVSDPSSSSLADAGAGAGAGASSDADFILRSIRNLPEQEAYRLMRHIRRDSPFDLSTLAETCKRTAALSFQGHAPDLPSFKGDLSQLLDNPSVLQTDESPYFGRASARGSVSGSAGTGAGHAPPPVQQHQEGLEHGNSTWTVVTADLAFVQRLLDLYFCWSHPFYVVFSRECFLKDFRSGRQKYCCPLLVNAILSYACHFTDEPAGRTDPDNFRTAGDHFFAEARRLLYEDESPSLTTTQALCVMAMREPSAGRDSSGFLYIGRCIRMAVELGLHLKATSPSQKLTPSEVEVRKVTFWGCFTVDTVWSLSVGCISQLPRAAITLDKPMLDEPTVGNKYQIYYGSHPVAPGTVSSQVFLQEFSSLSELVNDNNHMYFAPRERFTSGRLLDTYNKYLNWYNGLPPVLILPDTHGTPPQPHIIILHMLYHTVVLHLFRPMLKVDLIHSDIRPRDICIESANKVTDLLRLYRTFYDLRACQLVLTHILLSVSVVHLLYSQDYAVNATNLVDSLQGLEDLSVCHYFGVRSFKIVHALATSWNLPWPEALKLSKLVPKENAPPLSISIDAVYHYKSTPDPEELSAQGFPSVAPDFDPRRDSQPMFAPEHVNNPVPSMHALRTSGASGLGAAANLETSDPALGPTSPFRSMSAASNLSAMAPNTADTLFWSPPGVGMPILVPSHQLGPMDLSNVFGDGSDWDRFGRDGFKMSDTWSHDSLPFQESAYTTPYTQQAVQGGYQDTQGGQQGYPAQVPEEGTGSDSRAQWPPGWAGI